MTNHCAVFFWTAIKHNNLFQPDMLDCISLSHWDIKQHTHTHTNTTLHLLPLLWHFKAVLGARGRTSSFGVWDNVAGRLALCSWHPAEAQYGSVRDQWEYTMAITHGAVWRASRAGPGWASFQTTGCLGHTEREMEGGKKIREEIERQKIKDKREGKRWDGNKAEGVWKMKI